MGVTCSVGKLTRSMEAIGRGFSAELYGVLRRQYDKSLFCAMIFTSLSSSFPFDRVTTRGWKRLVPTVSIQYGHILRILYSVLRTVLYTVETYL